MTQAKPFRLADYLGHILEAIERCHDYVQDVDEVGFLGDHKTQDAVIRTFEVIGEASSNIRKQYPEFVLDHPEIPFGQAIGMRNVLSHGYFSVDLEAVWATIHKDLSSLYEAVKTALDSVTK